MQARVKNVPEPARIIADKIVEELQGLSKYYLFVTYNQRQRPDPPN